MMRTPVFRAAQKSFTCAQKRAYSKTSPRPRHLMSMSDVNPTELSALVRFASERKAAIKGGAAIDSFNRGLTGTAVAMMFSKRSTRTRVSTEAAVAQLGGQPMFLGKDDIQLRVNESLLDTSKVISSMTSCMVARVGPHSDVTGLAEHSSVPVINALSDDYHPLQTIADFLTLYETLGIASKSGTGPGLGLEGLKVAWVGDSNNVLFDLATACVKLGVDISVASPTGYGIPDRMRNVILAAGEEVSSGPYRAGKLSETTIPEEAIKDADILVTDTWVSMGQESEQKKRLKAFEGYQITNDLAKRGGAKEDWKFMHCLPRHPEEVADEVFYSDRSLVFPEAENRLWAAVAALQGFVVNKGSLIF